MLTYDDGFGHFLWAMIPSSTSKCSKCVGIQYTQLIIKSLAKGLPLYSIESNKTNEEALLNYAYYIDVEMLAELKAEALKHTAQMKLRAEELSVLHIGYRQLTANELDRYDNENPPPLPYPYTDQVNNTAYVSAFMPSCLHISPGDDEWRQDGCKVCVCALVCAYECSCW